MNQTNEHSIEQDSMKDYLSSLSKPGDFLSGNPELLPKDLKEKYLQFASLEESYFTGDRFHRKDERAPYTEALNDARKDYYGSLIQACEAYLNNKEINHQHNSDMKENQTNKTETKEKREPQMVTVNGDKITHAHAFKSNKSEDWFFTAKINDMQLKAQIMDKNDVERVLDKSASVKEMMEKYYPSVLKPKVNVAEFKLPKSISTANGEEQILKFNVYKEDKIESPNYGKYRFYAQVGDKRMSCNATKQDLDAYFNRVTTPVKLITKNFGDKLGIKDYYEQFKLPEGINIEGKDIRLCKNQETNRYQISVRVPEQFQTPAKDISYEDRQAYFQHKIVSKEQLASKYLSQELSSISMTMKPQLEKPMGISR